MPNGKSTVLIMAGGTGGHVFPALAVADELHQRGVDVQWLGTQKGIEAKLVPAADIPLNTIRIEGLRGKGVLKLLTAPFLIVRACWQAFGVLKQVKPQAVIGFGGFASGPGGLMAWLMRVPLILHEQNAIAGKTNSLLTRVATVTLQAFPSAFSGKKVVGNPVRADIVALPEPTERYQQRNGALRVLVLGGSLGAKAMNEVLPQLFSQLPEEARPLVTHQTGERWLDATQEHYRAAGVEATVVPFIDNMAQAYGDVDLVICRSGALTVSEIMAAGVASCLVPYPWAVDDHQTANAHYLVDADAAVLIQQDALTVDTGLALLKPLLTDRKELMNKAVRARRLAPSAAAKAVADECVELMHE